VLYTVFFQVQDNETDVGTYQGC